MSCRQFLLIIPLLFLLHASCLLKDVIEACQDKYNQTTSNDDLIGTWYFVYRFSRGGWMPASDWCNEIKYYKPSLQQIQDYKKKYNAPDLPYSFEDNPVIRNDSKYEGMVMGKRMSKYFVLGPKEHIVIREGYKVTVYSPLMNKKYLLEFDCELRENVMNLLSKDKAAAKEEIEDIVKSNPELKHLGVGQRMCAKYNNSTICNPNCQCNCCGCGYH